MKRALIILLAVSAPLAAIARRNQTDAKQALSKLQAYVGNWKGVGQLERGSRRGAWLEKSEWKWNFSQAAPELAFSVQKGKYFKQATLASGEKGAYELRATSLDDRQLIYAGQLQGGVLVLRAKSKTQAGDPARITIRTVAAGKRLVMLYERQVGSAFRRMSEVGYTRAGSNFGKGVTYVECVVTGGNAAIPVTFEGMTYYVCCSGCLEYFQDDPAGVIAEYKARKKEEKAQLDAGTRPDSDGK